MNAAVENVTYADIWWEPQSAKTQASLKVFIDITSAFSEKLEDTIKDLTQAKERSWLKYRRHEKLESKVTMGH